MLLLALFAATGSLQLNVDTREFSQVVFNVSCMSGHIACSRAHVEKFWHEELKWDTATQRQLDKWTSALRAIADRQPPPDGAPFMPNYQGYYPSLRAANRVIAFGLEAKSPRDFQKRARSSGTKQEVQEMTEALQYFRQRMRPWWRRQGEKYAASKRRQIVPVLNDTGDLAQRISRFTESEFRADGFQVHLIARGDPKSDAASATFLRNHVFLELTDSATPDFARSVILHEMTHAFYDAAPQAKHKDLIKQFSTSSEPQAQSYYTLLNEALATGVQLMIMRETGQSEKDAYRHAYIPRLGKVCSPLVAESLREGSMTVFRGFVERYLSAGAKEIGSEAQSPKFILLAVSIAELGELKKSIEKFRAGFATLASGDFGERALFPELNLLFLVPYDRLKSIEDNWRGIRSYAEGSRGFAFTAPRNSKGRVFVAAGQDDAAVAEVVERLAVSGGVPAEGLVFRLP